jgi:hypothetical protein
MEKIVAKLLNDIVEATYEVQKIYERLFNIEVAGYKDSIEYKASLNELKKAILKEDELINNDSLTYERCGDILDLLYSKIPDVDCVDVPDTLFLRNYDVLVASRVYEKINTKAKASEEYFKTFFEEKIKLLDISYKEMENTFKYNERLEESSEKDMLINSLVLLNEYIKSDEYHKLKNDFIHSKYFISFVSKEVENVLLREDFTIPEKSYITSRLASDFSGEKPEVYDFVTSLNTIPELYYHVSYLLSLEDGDYKIYRNSYMSVLEECFIRSLLLFLNDDVILEAYNWFNATEDNYKSANISKQIIHNCFNGVNKDREKIKYLSLYEH